MDNLITFTNIRNFFVQFANVYAVGFLIATYPNHDRVFVIQDARQIRGGSKVIDNCLKPAWRSMRSRLDNLFDLTEIYENIDENILKIFTALLTRDYREYLREITDENIAILTHLGNYFCIPYDSIYDRLTAHIFKPCSYLNNLDQLLNIAFRPDANGKYFNYLAASFRLYDQDVIERGFLPFIKKFPKKFSLFFIARMLLNHRSITLDIYRHQSRQIQNDLRNFSFKYAKIVANERHFTTIFLRKQFIKHWGGRVYFLLSLTETLAFANELYIHSRHQQLRDRYIRSVRELNEFSHEIRTNQTDELIEPYNSEPHFRAAIELIDYPRMPHELLLGPIQVYYTLNIRNMNNLNSKYLILFHKINEKLQLNFLLTGFLNDISIFPPNASDIAPDGTLYIEHQSYIYRPESNDVERGFLLFDFL